MTDHAQGQNPLVYAGLAAVFVAVLIYMFFYTRRMRSLGNKKQDTTSEIVRELRADGTTIDAPTGTKEQKREQGTL